MAFVFKERFAMYLDVTDIFQASNEIVHCFAIGRLFTETKHAVPFIKRLNVACGAQKNVSKNDKMFVS